MKAQPVLKIDYFGRDIEISVARSRARRRTLSLVVRKNGLAELRVPYLASREQIQKFVTEKTPWIVKTMDRMAAMRPRPDTNSFRHLGAEIGIEIVPTPLLKKGGFCTRQDENLLVQIPALIADDQQPAYARRLVNAWRQTEALSFLKARTDFYAAQTNIQYKTLKIAAQKTRWGSCDLNGVLRLNWHVMQCPVDIIDYLIVHELCHIPHPNHSPSFWRAVEKIIPDYKARRAILKTYENY